MCAIAFLDPLRQDVVYASRALKRSRGFTAVACLTMVLGIGATTALFSVLHAVLLRSLPYHEADSLVHVLGDDPHDSRSGVSFRVVEDLRSANGLFSRVAVYYRNTGWSRITFGGAGDAESMQAGFTSASFFTTLGVSPSLGRVFDEAEERQRAPVAVLSTALWQRRFGGNPAVIGRTVEIDGRIATVIGIMPPEFRFPARDTQLWLPITTNRFWGDQPVRDGVHTRGFYARWNVVGRLRPGISAGAADAALQELQKRLAREDPDWNLGSGIRALPLRIEINTNARLALLVSFGSVCLVLLIACANVAHLLLARGAVRAREFSVRAALGATAGRMTQQLLTETLLLVTVAACGAMLLAEVLIRLLVQYGPPDLPRLDEARIDWAVVSFTLLISALATLLAGILPALRAGHNDPSEHLKSGRRTTTDSRVMTRTGSLLVVSELAFAVLLLVTCGLLLRSLHAAESVPLGFSPDHLLTARIRLPDGAGPVRQAAFEEQVLARLRSLPGVLFAGGIQSLFELDRPPENSLRAVEGQPVGQRVHGALTWTTVSGEYFRAMRIPLLSGRHFTERDTAASPLVAIVDEAMARRYWPHENPVGKRFKGQDERGAKDDWLTVIGVVGSARRQGVEQDPTPHVYQWHKQAGPVNALVLRTAADPAGLARDVRAAVRALEARAVVTEVMPMAQQLARQTASRRFQAWLLTLFAGLALLLSMVGIYGVISYRTAQRTHELAIRMALGAPAGGVLVMVLRNGMSLAVRGLAMGFTAALVVTRILSSLLYGVTATDPATFAGVAVMLLAVAASAVILPAWRATRVDPLTALRSA